MEKKAWRQLHKNAERCDEKSSEGGKPQNISYTATSHLSWKLSKLDEPDMGDTAGKVRTNS